MNELQQALMQRKMSGPQGGAPMPPQAGPGPMPPQGGGAPIQQIIMAIMQKMQSGQPLSPEEEMILQQVQAQMQGGQGGASMPPPGGPM